MNDEETLSMDECLYAIFLASANEVSNAVAEHISGGTEKFAELMTSRAKALGAKNTNFVNPHGLHDGQHYTSAYDMALIMKSAIADENFLRYISTINFNIPPTERQPEERVMYNSNKMIIPGSVNYYEFCVGGKTGFTDEAQHTLVTYAKKGGVELICVTLMDEENNNYKDSAALFEYGFSLYGSQKILSADVFSKNIPVKDELGKTVGDVKAYIKEDIYLDMPKNIDKNKLVIDYGLGNAIYRPIKKGDILGTVSVLYEGLELKSLNIYASNGANIPETELVIGEAENIDKNETDGLGTAAGSVFVYMVILLALILLFILLVRVALYIFIGRKYRDRRFRA
jgi:D-alanyl-D-alanine carboxypeptidase